MSAGKLKNIILLILLLTNLFLLGQTVLSERRSAKYREAAIADAIAILSDSGIAVTRDRIPDGAMPAGRIYERDRAGEAGFAQALLGEEAEAEPAGSAATTVYRSSAGSLRFFGDGLLEANLAAGAFPVGREGEEAHAVRLLARLGFDGETLAAERGDGTVTVTVRQRLAGWPVFSCTVRCTYTEGSLTALSGRRVAGPAAPAEDEGLSMATLLVRFRNAVRERGDVCSEILSMEPGYEPVAAFTGPSRLVPILAIKIDGNRQFFLNMKTGELRPA